MLTAARGACACFLLHGQSESGGWCWIGLKLRLEVKLPARLLLRWDGLTSALHKERSAISRNTPEQHRHCSPDASCWLLLEYLYVRAVAYLGSTDLSFLHGGSLIFHSSKCNADHAIPHEAIESPKKTLVQGAQGRCGLWSMRVDEWILWRSGKRAVS